MLRYREEQDSVGTKKVPANAYYGVQSLRAMENFRITGRRVHPEFVRSIVEVKKAAAKANREAGALEESIADVIVSACDDILSGKYTDNFIVDTIQGGAGTSLNMNANEVVANRAIELLGGAKGSYNLVHPNDHVNCGQSTNDVYPTAGKIAVIRMLEKAIVQLEVLKGALQNKAEEYHDVIKMGRTEMQDAVPISFGQVFNAFAGAISRDIKRFSAAIDELSVLNMGGTAIGTGITADKEYIKNIVPHISQVTGLDLVQADDLVDATQNLDCFVFVSGIIKSCATNLSKIANDLRLMSSGPRTGFGEINLEPKQNGSSIMPGKINPVIPEVVSQIAFNIIGNDTTITLAAESGQLELNAFEPIIFHCLFESLETLTNGAEIFAKECIETITVNRENCARDVEWSMGTITALCPHIGYTKASTLAKRAMKENKNIRQVLLEEKVMTESELDAVLDPKTMI
ncbi:MAG: aspartate ammonia-lyase [Ruminococcaceae bacterium]|nr:aspartate ammonia-lyase [Oscillospiraceae bacterium]